MPGSGWDHIINAVGQCAVSHSHTGETKITDIKEKYGTLRMSISPCTDYTNALEDLAEEISEVTCESCGNLGIMREVRGWWKVRCEPCLLEEEKEANGKDISRE